jgi:hypothetical protein
VGDTYDSAAEAEADREQQKALLGALGAWVRALRRDECGAWCIHGIKQYKGEAFHNSVHTWGDGRSWAVYVQCRSCQHWTWTKKKLSFCTVTQDGDDEGVLRLHQLPTPEQADVIRDILGIRKRMELSPEDLERRRASMTALLLAQGSANATAPLPTSVRDETPILDPELFDDPDALPFEGIG